MEYEWLKKLIKNSVSHCDQLKDCFVTDAYPNRHANSPVKRTICAIGLLSAEEESGISHGMRTELSSAISLYADIYTPLSLGGSYSWECAVALLKSTDFDVYSKYTMRASVSATEFVSSCAAYRTRVVFSAVDLDEANKKGDALSAYYLFFNDSQYLCRSATYSLSPVNSGVECYGEAYPAAFVSDGVKIIATVERYGSDDEKPLSSDIIYPFRFEDMMSGVIMEDCAVVEYEKIAPSFERFKIEGRRVDE